MTTGTMNVWQLFETLMKKRTPRICVWGPPGIGKSYTPWAVASAEEWEFFSVTLTDQTPMSELRGHFILKDNSYVWHDGIIAKAWRLSHKKPVVLVINEIVEASADAEVFLHNAMDDPELARMDLPNGETIRPHPSNLMVIATMNGRPDNLREALRDRFPVMIEVIEPHPAAIAALPQDLRKFAIAATSAKAGPERMSIRPIAAFAKLRESLKNAELAAQAVWGPKKGAGILASMLPEAEKKKEAPDFQPEKVVLGV